MKRFVILFLFAIMGLVMAYSGINAFAYSSSNVYQISDADFDKYAYTWGEHGKLSIVSPLDNKDPQRIEVITTNNSTFNYEISVFPDSTRQANFILTETGPDTGLFEWDFVISEPDTKTTYDINSNYIIVSDSTEHINFEFDVDSINGYTATAKITYPNDNTLPSDEQTQQMLAMHPRISSVYSIQFRNGTMTSPYDGQGIITVQYPSQNKSSATVDQLKVAFSAYGAQRVFEILNETGSDTGVFEGPLSFSSYESFSKIHLIKSDSNTRSVTVYYLVSDTFSPPYSSSILLHHGLEYPDNKPSRVHRDSVLHINSDKKAYLNDQPIKVSGIADPNETIHISVLSNRGSLVLFEKLHADKDGKFEDEFAWSESPSTGTYTVEAVSIADDRQVKNQIIITSMEDLESHSIEISPLQQSKMGLDVDEIVCKRVWKLILKPGGEAPFCVKLPTYTKLLERGWESVT